MPQLIIGYFITFKHEGFRTLALSSLKQCSKSPSHNSGNGNFCQHCGNPTEYIKREVTKFSVREITDKIAASVLNMDILVKRFEDKTHFILPLINDYLPSYWNDEFDEISHTTPNIATEQKFNELKEMLTSMLGRDADACGFGMWREPSED